MDGERTAAGRARHVAGRLASWALASPLDLVGVVCAFAFGLPSLGFRYGRDQALFHYVGRELLGGSVLYRDVFDIKPPGVYVVYAINHALFGATTWGIRLFDLCAVVLAGSLAGLAALPRRQRSSGAVGMGALVASALYFCVLDPWHAAQAEGFGMCALMAGLAVALRSQESPRRLGGWLGLLVGAAFLFKPTLALPGLVVGAAGIARVAYEHPSRRARQAGLATLTFGAAGALTTTSPFLLLALAGAGDALVELTEFLSTYRGASQVAAAEGLSQFFLDRIAPVTALLCVLGFTFVRRGGTARSLAAALFLGAAILSVAAQQKYWLYHWGAALIPLAFAASMALARVVHQAHERLFVGVAFAAALLALAPAWQSDPTHSYRSYVASGVWRLTGEEGVAARDSFGRGEAAWAWSIHRGLAELVLEQRPGPEDALYVRGYEPGVYVLTGMAAPFRFVVDEHFWYARSELTERWEREHEAKLREVRPRFVITFVDRVHDTRMLTGLGYEHVGAVAGFVLLERREASGGEAAGGTHEE
ncbi:MAG: hypothetical protein KF901_03740 [Myxococcales bacterium]|nr:hypothetical protein [Myxococcales bacterium]